ncbi:MAG: hypothetical protein GEV03_26880 [Streptosporangiales bacterium]|nr:hypothetical protein [Streptosporangiales bacterium]
MTGSHRSVADLVVAAVASVLLSGFALFTCIAGLVFAFASDPCTSSDEELICTTLGQQIAVMVPFVGALVVTLTVLFGAWVWPRKRRLVWLVGGFVGVLLVFLVGLFVARTGP